ncbi:MAG: cell division protein ZipA C-terminal FtsZ-binding domain-containing protein [Sulfuricella sp.]|nr:cell division protein ZipA C-terminal FtsZ-binding domain-containing protein [Sulfuricella sp.]
MSELQISLLAIGGLIVAGVYGFNRLQDRKYRRRAEQAFPGGQEDVLLKEHSQDLPETGRFREEPRIEPVVSVMPAEAEPDEPPRIDAAGWEEAVPDLGADDENRESELPAAQPNGATLDDSIDYVVRILAAEPVSSAAVLIEARQGQDGFGKRTRWLGINPSTGGWEEIGQGSASEYRELAATLQLADRSGPVSEPQLLAFCAAAQAVAGALTAIAEFPERPPALARAAALDQFGAEVDVLVGVNVITQNGDAFAATKVRALAEAAGMKLQADGAFHFINDEGADLYSLANLDPTPFSPENIRQLTSHGITFLFDVPKVADGVRAFNQMLLVAKQMASTLGGVVVDDNRRPLSVAGIGKIKQQLADIYVRMEAQQIKGGSDCALRLFS